MRLSRVVPFLLAGALVLASATRAEHAPPLPPADDGDPSAAPLSAPVLPIGTIRLGPLGKPEVGQAAAAPLESADGGDPASDRQIRGQPTPDATLLQSLADLLLNDGRSTAFPP